MATNGNEPTIPNLSAPTPPEIEPHDDWSRRSGVRVRRSPPRCVTPERQPRQLGAVALRGGMRAAKLILCGALGGLALTALQQGLKSWQDQTSLSGPAELAPNAESPEQPELNASPKQQR